VLWEFELLAEPELHTNKQCLTEWAVVFMIPPDRITSRIFFRIFIRFTFADCPSDYHHHEIASHHLAVAASFRFLRPGFPHG
jgi:hypothetical protein